MALEMPAFRQPLSLGSPAPRRSCIKECLSSMCSGMDERKFKISVAHVGMIGANAAFGAFNVWAKIVISSKDGLDPIFFGLYRVLAVLPLLMIWTSITGGWRRIANYSDAGNMLLLGVSGIGLYQACHFIGLQNLGADTASSYNPLSAIFSAAFAVFPWRYERPSWRKAIGSLIGLAGILIVVGKRDDDERKLGHREYVVGNVWCFFGALAGSVSFLLQKPLLRKYSSRMTLAIAYIPAVIVLALFSVPHVLGYGEPDDPRKWTVNSDDVLPLVVSVFLAGFGFLTMLWANKFLDASISAGYCVVQPLAAELAKALSQDEAVEVYDLAGCALLLLALVAVSSKNDAGNL